MKRNWRAGRIILAVLLLSLAGVAFYVWPMGPRWRIDVKEPVGFDLKEGLLYATNAPIESQQYVLHGYDLVTGECKVSMPVPLETSAPVNRSCWSSILSSDCSTMACWNVVESAIQVFDVRKRCQRLFDIKVNHLIFDGVNLSSTGEFLALRNTGEVQVWDCQAGKIMKTLKMPDRTFFGDRSGLWRCSPEGIHFSGDGHYLAVSGDNEMIVVFDLRTDRVIGECLGAEFPVFLSNNRTLITLPRINSVRGIKCHQYSILPPKISFDRDYWDQFDEDRLNQLSRKYGNGYILQANSAVILVYEFDVFAKKLMPSWAPDVLRNKLEAALGWTRETMVIQSSECHSHHLRDGFEIQILGLRKTQLSPDGLLLAIEENHELSLWDIPPHRSVTSWMVFSALAVFALWLGYPRRLKSLPLG